MESQLDINFAISANNSNHHYIPLRVRYWQWAINDNNINSNNNNSNEILKYMYNFANVTDLMGRK